MVAETSRFITFRLPVRRLPTLGAVHQALRHVLEEVYGLQVHGEAAGEAYALLVAVEAVETDGDLWEEVDSNPQREGHTL